MVLYLFPSSSESARSPTDFLGLGAGTGGRTTGGHMPGFSAALLAAVSRIAVLCVQRKWRRSRGGEIHGLSEEKMRVIVIVRVKVRVIMRVRVR